jgi:hypothetical protein
MNFFASIKNVSPYSWLASIASMTVLGACGAEAPPAEEIESAPAQALAVKGTNDPSLTCTPPTDLDPARSLMVTDAAALARFPLQAVLNQLILLSNVSGPDALGLYQRWWDSQNTSALSFFPDAIHCDDELDANGNPAINGFPIQCPRNEGVLALSNPFLDLPVNLAFMKPVAVVNRFDLAPTDGSHCGEYRIIYAKRSGELNPLDRNLIIIEAQIPNPNPSCGIAACLPIAEFWASLTSENNVNARADALESFYFDGLPGFPPVIHPAHLSDGAGQIRTNQFMLGLNQQIWQLREFQLEKVCNGTCTLRVKPVSVKANPFGALFNTNFADTRRAPFQAHFPSSVAGLAPQDVNAMGMFTPNAWNAGQSNSQGTENDYAVHLAAGGPNNAFEQAINAQLASLGRTDLTAANIADRATAQSCGGCHELSSGDQLGGVQWPAHAAAGTFVHVSETSQLSVPLTQVFLPRREQVLLDYLNEYGCETCDSAINSAMNSARQNAESASAGDGSGAVRTLGGSQTH